MRPAGAPRLVNGALVLGAAAALVLGAAVAGMRLGLLDYRIGFGALVLMLAPLLLALGLVGGLIGLTLGALQRQRGATARGLAAVLLPLAIGAAYLPGLLQGLRAPPVHDVSTDRSDPPQFSQAVAQARARIAGANGLAYLDTGAYPDVQTFQSPLPPTQTYDLARNVARKQGWRITREEPRALTFHAEARSLLFGFTDDIVVRVRTSTDSIALLDVRSASRVGISDLGANAKRIRAFQGEVRATLQRAGALSDGAEADERP